MTKKEDIYMRIFSHSVTVGLGLFGFFMFCTNVQAEKLIKEETLSFEKCLSVIETTSKHIVMLPRVTADTSKLKIVEFDLADGILSIRCDRKKHLVRITSK